MALIWVETLRKPGWEKLHDYRTQILHSGAKRSVMRVSKIVQMKTALLFCGDTSLIRIDSLLPDIISKYNSFQSIIEKQLAIRTKVKFKLFINTLQNGCNCIKKGPTVSIDPKKRSDILYVFSVIYTVRHSNWPLNQSFWMVDRVYNLNF